MGFDVSYHPISEQEMDKWYFKPLEWVRAGEVSRARRWAEEAGLEPFYADKYLDTLTVGAQTEDEELFDKSHSFYLAVVQGFFRTFYYTRGAAFTFLVDDPQYRAYTKSWPEIWHKPWPNKAYGHLVENYCGGVYLPPEQVRRLLADYEQMAQVRRDLERVYSHGRLAVFLKALHAACEQGLGILEATEVVTPNPFDPNSSACFANLLNCDVDGVLLYIQAAQEQLAEARQK